MKKILALFTLVLLCLNLYSQTEICGHNHQLEKRKKINPYYQQWIDSFYAAAQAEYKDALTHKRRIVADTEYYEIPVVFHVVYNTNAQNISINLINSQMDELNNAFRRRNADSTRIRSVFKSLYGDIRIQFKLATVDPNGNPTTGITRTSTLKTTFGTSMGSYVEDMKSTVNGGKDAWNPRKYLNIWICNMQYPNIGAIVYGFATPPDGSPNWENFPNATKDTFDNETGVVLHYEIVGRNNPLASARYKEGKTAIHEVGHYLGLRHVWGDGGFNGCSVDDGIEDTPNARVASSNCNGQNTCTDASNDKPDQTENYMDYALDGCAAMFTNGQAYMMRYVLQNLRTGLPFRKINYKEVNDDYKFSVYPNPQKANQDIKLELSSPENKTYKIKVINSIGQQIIEKSIKTNSTISINNNEITDSVYFIILLDENNNVVERKKVINIEM